MHTCTARILLSVYLVITMTRRHLCDTCGILSREALSNLTSKSDLGFTTQSRIWIQPNRIYSISDTRLTWFNTRHVANGFLHTKQIYSFVISNFHQPISRLTEPRLGMFVLISMHFTWLFQIQYWHLIILTFSEKNCWLRLHIRGQH